MAAIELDKLTTAQVTAAFVTAGIRPTGDVSTIAQFVTSQLSLTRTAFASTPFGAEPATFMTVLIDESL